MHRRRPLLPAARAGAEVPGGTVALTLARMLTVQALEAGEEGLDGRLGDGTGKWRLTVTADQSIQVMSLLMSRSGHLANLSTVPVATPSVSRIRATMRPEWLISPWVESDMTTGKGMR